MAQESKIILKSSINRKNQIAYCIHSHKNINCNRNNEKENLYLFDDKTKKLIGKDETQNLNQKVKPTPENTRRKPLQNLYKTNKILSLKKKAKITTPQKVYEDVTAEEFPIQKNSKLITTQRDYDFLCMNNLSIECSNDKNYFFEDEIGDAEIPNSVMICTPANSFILQNHIKAIKEVRKGVSKYSESNSETDITKDLHLAKYCHRQTKNIKSHSILGVVNLDSEKNSGKIKSY